ncbi:hypothetical protein BDAP_001613 [Binucleata daphniae]
MLQNYPARRTNEKIQSTTNIRTNLVRMTNKPKTLHHYLVTFTPELKRDQVFRSFQRIIQENDFLSAINHAFDGINMLVTDKKLENDKTVISYQVGKDKFECSMEVAYKNSYDMADIINKSTEASTHIQCLEVVARYYQLKNCISDGRRAFNDTDISKISKGVEVWTGLSQSFKITAMGILNNVDIAFQVYYQSINLIDLMIELSSRPRGGSSGPRGGPRDGQRGGPRDGQRGGYRNDGPRDGQRGGPRDGYRNDGPRRYPRDGGENEKQETNMNKKIDVGHSNTFAESNHTAQTSDRYTRAGGYNRGPDSSPINAESIAKLTTILKKTKVTATHMKDKEFTFKASGLTDKPANEITFEIDGKTMSVADYFEMKYKRLEHPNLPCVVRSRKGREDVFFPIEVLKLSSNQKYPAKLDEFQTSQMIKVAVKTPIRRFQILNQKIKELAMNQNETLNKFNVVFENNFVTCKGRVLQPPQLEYGKGSNQVRIERGSWNLRNVTALEPVTVNKWLFVHLSTSYFAQGEIEKSMNDFIRICGNFQLNLNPRFEIVVIDQPSQYSEAIRRVNPQFVLFILPSKDASAYKQVKWRSEADGGKIVSQCVVYNNFAKFSDPMFASNLALKINVKLKGKNWKLVDSHNMIKNKSTIVFGADVSHPGTGEQDSPSIAAVTSSLDLTLNHFNTTIRVQERRKEIIDDLVTITKNKLVKFYNYTKTKPERIIFFRDGVGESQFYTVFEEEIASIKEACKKLEPSYSPKITYIVAQKRHSVRFELLDECQENRRPGKEPSGNVLPGTVVDEIGHPVFFDFYMVTHHALQGTARPVRYQVLLNENGFTAVEIQQMINNMCHQYPRATKAVSIVPAIYYAHLAAARAKCYFIKNSDNMDIFRDFHQDLEDQLFYM